MIGLFSRALSRIPHLETLLGEPTMLISRFHAPGRLGHVAGWGLKAPSLRAQHYAEKHLIPYLYLEEGFLRSVNLPGKDATLSLIADPVGIYYDAHHPSLLEELIPQPLDARAAERARRLIAQWRDSRISKYNHNRDYTETLPTPYVLVVDQTLGDASIQHGMADAATFQHMLSSALVENPECQIVLKLHPEVASGRKRGHFDLKQLANTPRLTVLGDDVHPASLIAGAAALYVVTSQIGFEGLLWGKPVHTFGMPFYAGWGLTEDRLAAPARRQPVELLKLVHAALVAYPRYVDPESGRRCEVERVISWLGLQRRLRMRLPDKITAMNFSFWKAPILKSFLQGSEIRFVSSPHSIATDSPLVIWGNRSRAEQLPTSNIIRIEDGFLRSVGLGADLTRPSSWVIDRQGIYYDATQASELESLLKNTEFDDTLLQRAQALRREIVKTGITKYNTVERARWKRPDTQKKLILVPGQVESDASIQYGGTSIRSNLSLLMNVRFRHRDAYIIYKPHPDVVAGLRSRGKGESQAPHWCDELITDIPMHMLLDQVDEVHTMTSLTGFEALMRGIPVVTYGQPFYAGWGLTQDNDILPPVLARRGRQLSLDQLVAATLILYPRYISRITGKFTTPERILTELQIWRNEEAGKRRIVRKQLRWLLRLRRY
ncbi:capsular polysaccharide biosynthesis protein [Pseudomethylobacillus aquaticus]|nr:capsular polysaccharide biosynthesis protein [Pseudomethylobacillus aquaticus]